MNFVPMESMHIIMDLFYMLNKLQPVLLTAWHVGLSPLIYAFYVVYYSILQFLKISPIIPPNMPINLLLLGILISNQSCICWCIMKIVMYTKQCYDYHVV